MPGPEGTAGKILQTNGASKPKVGTGRGSREGLYHLSKSGARIFFSKFKFDCLRRYINSVEPGLSRSGRDCDAKGKREPQVIRSECRNLSPYVETDSETRRVSVAAQSPRDYSL